MSKVKSFQSVILAMIVLSILFPFMGQTSTKKSDDDTRGDRIILQLGEALSKNEMPAVGFLHDLHTQAVEGKCAVCHDEKEQGLVFKFKRASKSASMEVYHDQCIVCHIEKKAAGERSGPLSAECGSCHVTGPSKGSSRVKLRFDKSLHFIHENSDQIRGKETSSKENCSACHHKYNEKTKEIFYIKGEEESCAYCHKSSKQGIIRPLRDVSHDACVACHQTLKTKNINAGPVTCNGCHDIGEQQKIKKISPVPRLNRNQPDEVAITGWKADTQTKKTYMDGVAFDHKAHEATSQSCKVCHHETLKKCNDCHGTEGGKPKGGFINLGQAMHKKDSTRSCIGCHNELTKSADCAGCHTLMPSDKINSESCQTCHSLPQSQLKSGDPVQIAKTALTDMSKGYKTVQEDKIPEHVVIDALANEYMPSSFPHRRVVQAIGLRVEKSQMAKAFHKDQAGLCMGCHHNSPRTLDPPKCASCHSKNGPGKDGRPGLKGAYHGQCITCHQKMDVKAVAATDCAKCHEEKK